ncbi:uncharacterized protein LOC121962448 [Plectropomus leopardus]|uniref:uncharacterized protein LOC121962448 n=1 Tax=Plectropomus leopardus TaxID=160734 RepID=UPI001C4B392A|nr:uncharacterized protein LOC121962448 [Plectropomus leopardus]
MDMSNRRIIILGKTGAGKSSLANTIVGEDLFTTHSSSNSGTARCQSGVRYVYGRSIKLVDTPGFFDTDRSERELKSEILRCIIECAPGPHAFLIVLKVERFTEHEQAVIAKIQKYFSEEAFKYATIVFTHGDQLPEGQTIEDFVYKNEFVTNLAEKCGGRCHVVDNRYWRNNQQDEYRNNHFQVEELLKTIDKTVLANQGRCYTNDVLQAMEEAMQEELKRARVQSEQSRSCCLVVPREFSISSLLFTEPISNRRIVILGKTGAGKSSLANTIFGEELFKIDHSLNSGTRECQAETRSVNGRSITLIDTPGFFDTNQPEEELRHEIVRCITECAPGPHAFFIVLGVERFTKHERAVIDKIHQYFSEEALKYATLVFTHGDQLDKGQTIADFVYKNQLATNLVNKCGGRCHVIDNKYWRNNQDNYRNNHVQVEKLLKTIDKTMLANQGRCYTNEVLQAVEKEIQQEERIRQSPGNMSEEEIREQAKGRVSKKISIKLAAFANMEGTATESGPTAGPSSSPANVSEDVKQETDTESEEEAGPSSSPVTEGVREESTTRRIVILGKTGAGKSSLINTILGEELFAINDSLNSGTRKCQAETRCVNGRSTTLIDTPGFFDTDISEEELKPEILRCITECAPGPHAFLIVLKWEKFTVHEKDIVNKINQYFSDKALKYATLVFTHGDQLPKGKTIENFVQVNPFVKDLVEKCGGRCHVIDNKYWDERSEFEYRSNRFQVKKLLESIDMIIEANKGGCYTNEMLQDVEKKIQQKEEEVRQSPENISEEEIREQAKDSVFEKLSIKCAGIGTGLLLGAFFGVLLCNGITDIAGLNQMTMTYAATGLGAMTGMLVGIDAAEGATTRQEAARAAAENVASGTQFLLDKINEIIERLWPRR